MSIDKSLTYTSYLALEEILGAQRPKSDEHDEILFIVVHQVYELWFKQLIHELRYLQRMLEEGNEARAFSTFKRVLTILKLVVQQLDVIETMTPVQFLTFRERLESSSGFQSGQFRELEAILGRRDPGVLTAYHEQSAGLREGQGGAGAAVRLRLVPARTCPGRATTFRPRHSSATSRSRCRSRRASRPRCSRRTATTKEPAQVAERLVDFDEGFMEWRYHHVKMVERTIGTKMGTGGYGAEYLRSTLHKPFFPDLWAVRSEL